MLVDDQLDSTITFFVSTTCLTLLEHQPIFACFGDLLSSIMGVSGKVMVSRSIRALFKANLAFKTIATFWAKPIYEIILNLKKSVQNRGSDHSLSHHWWYSQTIRWWSAKAYASGPVYISKAHNYWTMTSLQHQEYVKKSARGVCAQESSNLYIEAGWSPCYTCKCANGIVENVTTTPPS